MMLPVSDIHTNGRHRRDLGDLEALAASITEVGLLHPVVVTPDFQLVAGERRLEAVKLLGWTEVPVTVADTLETAWQLLKAERDENTCRKEFSPSEMVSVGTALEHYEKAAAKTRMSEAGKGRKVSLPSQTRDMVGAAVGVSGRTYEKAKAVIQAAEAEPELFGPVAERMDKSGKVDFAFMEVKRIKAAQALPADLPEGKFRVIYADPPWSYGNSMPEYFTEQAHHYPTMSMSAICALPVANIACDNAVLFLWVTSPILEDSFRVINSWGFTYKASFVWDKIGHNMGHYNSVRHEFLLVATRGSCQPDVRKLFDSVVSVERGEHSQKPEQFREIIDTIYPNGPRVELFARNKAEGWEAFGNELS